MTSATAAAVVAATEDPWYVWLYHSALLQVLIIIAVSIVLQILLNVTIGRLVASITARMRRTAGERPARLDTTADLTAALGAERGEQRAESIGQLLRSAGTFAIWAIATVTILSQFNVDIAPLLASAGVVSVALAFGAQTLVKDYLSGIAMIVEDQLGVGDVVDLGPVTGTVEEVTLRVTKLRDASGVVWYVRNGEVMRVANRSQGWTMAIVDMPVAYDADLDVVARVVGEVGRGMYDDSAYDQVLLSVPAYAGIESVSGDAVMVRVTAKAASDQQLSATRAIREQLKSGFDAAGIRVPSLLPYGQTPGQAPGQAPGQTPGQAPEPPAPA